MRPYVPLGSIMAISVFTRPWPCVGMVLSSALNRSNPKNKMHNTKLFNFSYQRFFPTRGRIRKISADITYSEWKYKNKNNVSKCSKLNCELHLRLSLKSPKLNCKLHFRLSLWLFVEPCSTTYITQRFHLLIF